MAENVLDAFIRLFVDDSQFKQKMGALKVEAEKAGAGVSRAFEQGARGGAPGRLLLGGERFGGLGGPGGPTPTIPSPGGGGGRGGAGRGLAGAFGRGGPVREAARVAGLGGVGQEFAGLGRLAISHPLIATAAAGAAVFGKYVLSVKAATDAEQELAREREAGDPAAVNALLSKRIDALRDLEDAAREAYRPINSLEDLVRAGLGTFTLWWDELAGKGAGQRSKEVEAATKAATEMWQAFGVPQQAIDQLKRHSAELQASGEAAIKAAEDTVSYSAATEMLIKAKEEAAQAEKQALDLADERLRKDTKMAPAEREARIAENQLKRLEIDKKFARERTTIEDDRRRQIGEMEAVEIEHTQKMVSLAQQRHDAIVQTLGQIVEIESATTLSLEETYRARFALQAESTQNAIQALEAETAARRKALEARIGGATGQERVKLERDLTTLTEEHETKRTEIEGRNIAERLRLYRQAQQEKIALQERVFAIERTLGERSLHDDLARQTAIAAGARAGSQTQLRALEQVAQSVKALSDQAKAFLGEALAAQDAMARKTGAAAPEFVSRESLAQAAAARLTDLEEAQRTFAMGGQIGREQAQALAGGELGRLQQQKEAGQRGIAGIIGRGAPMGLATADPAAAFAEQINVAFEKPIDMFTTQVGPAFASMVSKAAPQFEEMTDVWSKAVDKMVAKAEDGSSKMGAALYENFKTRLTRDLEREVKTF